jgi:hypothetical protein
MLGAASVGKAAQTAVAKYLPFIASKLLSKSTLGKEEGFPCISVPNE